ncbi:hypothetical protein COL91_12855 [Bacillus pseudomycoides]|nr:hypothetical protein COO02_21270 [Bacillus pseudomycoides]PEI92753.1 hypothetical protein CN679_10070 [Bacillus pseudomycoides]PGA90761.1 hypothetical protein COL91_12855 [Bacillus pseudomycoides]PHF50695.1 hypothetical protein COF72_03735 [Bacillus pseudomycoides]
MQVLVCIQNFHVNQNKKASVQDAFLFFSICYKKESYILYGIRNENGRGSVYMDALEQFHNLTCQIHDEILLI